MLEENVLYSLKRQCLESYLPVPLDVGDIIPYKGAGEGFGVEGKGPGGCQDQNGDEIKT